MLFAKLKSVSAVPVVVLQRDFDPDRAARARLLAFHVDRLIVQHGLAAVQMLDEFGDAAVVQKFGRLLRILALIRQSDLEALVQEREFAQTLRERIEVELRALP